MARYLLKNIVEPVREGDTTRFLTIGEMREREEGPGFNIHLYLYPYDIVALVDERNPGRYKVLRYKTPQEQTLYPEGYDDYFLGNMQVTKSGDKFMLYMHMWPTQPILATPAERPTDTAPTPPPAPKAEASAPTEAEYDDIPF